MVMFACARARLSNARSISRPVKSLACKIRRFEWRFATEVVRVDVLRLAIEFDSEPNQALDHLRPRSTHSRTASSLHNPAPAVSVSLIRARQTNRHRRSALSDAAQQPAAVAASSGSRLVRITTGPCSAARNAKFQPGQAAASDQRLRFDTTIHALRSTNAA